MSEPLIEIPARLALMAGKFMHQMGPYTDSSGKIEAASKQILDAVALQLTSEEIDIAMVTARIEESA